MFFIPLLVIIIGFYFYISYIEKNLKFSSKFYLVVGLLFAIMILASLLVVFTNVIFYILSFLASYSLGLILHDEVSKHIEFFKQENT